MSFLNSLDQVWQNLIALLVIFFVFYWVYRNMNEGKVKDSIGNFFKSLKGDDEDGK